MTKGMSFLYKLISKEGVYHIRIPKSVLEGYGFSEGEVVGITLKEPEMPKVSEINKKLLIPYKKYFQELKDYTLKELNSCLFLFSVESTKCGDLAKEDVNQITKEFEQKIKEEKGEKFLEKYRTFKRAIKDTERIDRVVKESMAVSEDFKKSVELSKGWSIFNIRKTK